MKYEFTEKTLCTTSYETEGTLDYSYYPIKITIGKKEVWRYSFCHELGHALTTKLKRDAYIETTRELFKRELVCWRLAKSYCKGKYIDDKTIIGYLKNYARQANLNINWDKMKIIPVNTNKYLSERL